jgi:hypothetical protein
VREFDRYELPIDLFDSLPALPMEGLQAGAYGACFRAKMLQEGFDPRPSPSSHNPLGIPESVVTELQLREFGPTPLPAYTETTAEIRSLKDCFDRRVRSQAKRAISPPEVKPWWWLESDEKPEQPYWLLAERKEGRRARAITR